MDGCERRGGPALTSADPTAGEAARRGRRERAAKNKETETGVGGVGGGAPGWKSREERDTERKGDLAGAFTGGCICIQTSQHALLRYWGQNQPAAASQPWPFTTSPTGRVCTS